MTDRRTGKSPAQKYGLLDEDRRASVTVDTVQRWTPGRPGPDILPVIIRWRDVRSWVVDRIIGRDEYGSLADGALAVR